MVAIPLVKEQIEAGQLLLQKLKASGRVPDYAAWVKETDVLEWRLYLIYPQVDQEGIKPTYYILRRCLDELRKASSECECIDEQSVYIVRLRDSIAMGIVPVD